MLNKYFKTNTSRYTLIGTLFGLLFPVIATIVRVSASISPFNFSTVLYLHVSDPLLLMIDSAPLVLGFIASIAGRRQDQLVLLNNQIMARESKLFQTRAALEKRVEDRTQELEQQRQSAERRSRQFEALATVAKSISKTKNLTELLPQITETISAQFGFYHVGIFLNDATNQFTILSAANSEGGQKMLNRGHRLKIGEQGIIGFVTSTGKPRISLDVGMDAVFFNNPDLPETHSEIGVPLVSAAQIIGALDVQSTQPNAFTGEDIDILTTLADQVSLAIENTRLFEQTQKALKESEAISRQYLSQTWGHLAEEKSLLGFRYASGGVTAIQADEPALKNGDEKSQVTVPIQLRGTTIGSLRIAVPQNGRVQQNQMDLINAVAERVALAAENARLFEETSQRAERERIISEIAGKMGASFRTESILSTTAKELSQFLEGAEILIQLNVNNDKGH